MNEIDQQRLAFSQPSLNAVRTFSITRLIVSLRKEVKRLTAPECGYVRSTCSACGGGANI